MLGFEPPYDFDLVLIAAAVLGWGVDCGHANGAAVNAV
jgi:hypothetical protein